MADTAAGFGGQGYAVVEGKLMIECYFRVSGILIVLECLHCHARMTVSDPEEQDEDGNIKHFCTNLECSYEGWHAQAHPRYEGYEEEPIDPHDGEDL